LNARREKSPQWSFESEDIITVGRRSDSSIAEDDNVGEFRSIAKGTIWLSAEPCLSCLIKIGGLRADNGEQSGDSS